MFDDIITDIISDKKLHSVVTELFIRGRKLNIFLMFITQVYFPVLKDARLNATQATASENTNKQEL